MSRTRRYPYSLYLYPDPNTHILKEIYRPVMGVKISKGAGQPSLTFDAMVDSGSDRNILPAHLATEIGLSLDKRKIKRVSGVGGSIVAYPAKINIWIGSKKYETEADFTSEQEIPLLGRNGFFNLFKSVKFDENKRLFYIEE